MGKYLVGDPAGMGGDVLVRNDLNVNSDSFGKQELRQEVTNLNGHRLEDLGLLGRILEYLQILRRQTLSCILRCDFDAMDDWEEASTNAVPFRKVLFSALRNSS